MSLGWEGSVRGEEGGWVGEEGAKVGMWHCGQLWRLASFVSKSCVSIKRQDEFSAAIT